MDAIGDTVNSGSVIQILPSPVTPAAVTNEIYVPEQAVPVVNVGASDLTPMSDLVRELTEHGKAERRTLEQLADRASAPPLVTVAMPDTLNMRIIEQPKRRRRTRITDRDGNGRMVETETLDLDD